MSLLLTASVLRLSIEKWVEKVIGLLLVVVLLPLSWLRLIFFQVTCYCATLIVKSPFFTITQALIRCIYFLECLSWSRRRIFIWMDLNRSSLERSFQLLIVALPVDWQYFVVAIRRDDLLTHHHLILCVRSLVHLFLLFGLGFGCCLLIIVLVRA